MLPTKRSVRVRKAPSYLKDFVCEHINTLNINKQKPNERDSFISKSIIISSIVSYARITNK